MIHSYDRSCGHPEHFRIQEILADSMSEFCVQCELRRRREEVLTLQSRVSQYAAIHPLVDVNCIGAGDKIVFWYPQHGWPTDSARIIALGVKLGDVVTVDRAVVRSASSDLYLKEFPGKIFNPVNFGVLKPDPNPAQEKELRDIERQEIIAQIRVKLVCAAMIRLQGYCQLTHKELAIQAVNFADAVLKELYP